MGNKQSVQVKLASDYVKPSKDSAFDVYSFPFENVVFEGGSNNLLAFVGAVQVREALRISLI